MKLRTVVRKEILELFFVILAFVLMVVVSYYFVSRIVENLISTNANETMNTAEKTIQSDLREAELTLIHAGLVIGQALANKEPQENIQSYLTQITDTMKTRNDLLPGLLNIYTFFENKIISGHPHTVPESFIAESRPWYIAAEAAEGGIGLTSPFIDATTGKVIISLAKTMSGHDGEKLGTVAIDLDFSFLSAFIKSLHFAKDGYGLMFDEKFTLLVHPNESFLNRYVVDVNPSYETLVRKLLEHPLNIYSMRIVSYESVPTLVIAKQLYNGWYLGIATPISNYYKDINIMALTLSILGVIFMSILSFILIRLSLLKARSDEENLGKSSFLARMSHEIRTPMNSILGMAELIQRKSISDEIREYIEIINQSGNNLLSIINDILDFSKIESGRLQIQNRDYQLASVINDMVNMIRTRVAEKSLDFVVNIESGIPAHLYGDDTRLRQILTNLLSNAAKYTRKGYISLDVGMEKLDANTVKLNLAVRDTGIGIKNEDTEKLFNEFARIDALVNQGIEGTGLGLVITRALCRAMGGDVTVQSEYEKGSVFRAHITQGFENDEPVASVIDPEKKRVLFYDWRPEHIKSISNTLKSLGVDYKCATEFHEFIRDLGNGPFNYAFISSKYAQDCLDIPAMRDEPIQLAIMVEPGEVSVYREVTSILLPVYSISIANVLNNVSGEVIFHDKNLKIKFTAPSANILIVDDISTNLRVAKELMAPYNMNIHTCLSGSEAISLLKKFRYDIVFMDHMMPGMDGIEATAIIRGLHSEDGYYEGLPIIALTANALSGQREMFLERGFDDFLPKPIEIQKLDEILDRLLPIHKREEADHLYHEFSQQEDNEDVDISGIDIVIGLRNCGGDLSIYFDILDDFCKDAETRCAKINDALALEDTKLYSTLVHALKGAARSIGALETGEKASWLEKAASDGNIAALKGKTSALINDTQTLINNVRTVLDKHAEEEDQENSEISSLRLETLKAALEEMDIEAVNRILLVFTGLSLNKEAKRKISEIEQLVLMFEYEKAIEKIKDFF